MNPMNPNLYPESVFPQQGQQLPAQLNQTQRDIDRIIVHDTHGLPIKREHGAIYKGDIENKVSNIERGPDPHVPIGQEAVLMGTQPMTQTIPVTTTTTTTTQPIAGTTLTEEEYTETAATGQKPGFMGKMKTKLANWKERRREKKARKREGVAAGGTSSSSPSPSPERGETLGTTTAGTTAIGTGVVNQPPPTYITQGAQLPIRDTTKDYSRNLAMEVPSVTGQPIGAHGLLAPTGESLPNKAKDTRGTGAWDYPDQRIQKIEQHFPEQRAMPIFTQPVNVIQTTQVPVTTQFTSIEQQLTNVPLTTLATPTNVNYEQVPIHTTLPVATTFSQQPIIADATGPIITQTQPIVTQTTETFVQQIPQQIQQTQQFQPQLGQTFQQPIGQQLGQEFRQDLQQPIQNLASSLERASLNEQGANINLPYRSDFAANPMTQPNLTFQPGQAVQPGMMGDLTTGALRNQQLSSSSAQPLQSNLRTIDNTTNLTNQQQFLK